MDDSKKVKISISVTNDININKWNFIEKGGEQYKDDFLDLCVSRKAFHHASLNQSHLTNHVFETFSTNTSMNMWRCCTVDYIFMIFQYFCQNQQDMAFLLRHFTAFCLNYKCGSWCFFLYNERKSINLYFHFKQFDSD